MAEKKVSSGEVWRGLHYDAKEEDAMWFNNCFIGNVHSPNAVHLLQDRLIDKGVFSFTVTLMGGNMVLVKPVEGEDFLEFVKDYEDLVETWFADVRPWSPWEVAREKETWVTCQGVPLQGWSSQIFEMVVGKLGRFISLDSNKMNMKRLDVAWILIRTMSWEAINQVFESANQ